MCMLGREYMRVETVLYDTLEAESKNKDDSRHKDWELVSLGIKIGGKEGRET